MEARSNERKRTLIENVRKGSTVEEVENEVEEEYENVSVEHLTEEEKKKVVGGRKGSSIGGISPPSCQAEKCGADLTDAKKYHRRHKVCEFHSKAPVVVVAGLRQRFCQQCSRFHDLAEFDEAKRSCRRRLAGHNERRRKNNPEACNEGCRHSKGHHPKESQCRIGDERGLIQMNMVAETSGYKSFHIR
ncbi:hypothetical protein Lal_00029099 [Lupinus albus]|uniref:Putative transcription factor SBP family n=1 Tax=Lupinus albus TaxID=3870 RepID=A0A6A4NQC3_LUPAL|nr:putative transcription factor SBP family [Lupinus albus]KAF1885210.1 hypothetical protein Lal_00029099 [Lupinus albus]